MDLHARAAALVASPKARWALAWLAAPADRPPHPVDFHDAATVKPRDTRLHRLRDNPAGLLAEIHTRVEDWRYQRHAHTDLDRLGPADGYLRIAASLAQAPAAQWWWQPLHRDAQTWLCDDPGIRRGRRLPFATGYGHHWDRTAPNCEMTTSTRLPDLPSVALLSDQNRRPTARTDPARLSAWNVPLDPDAPVAEIHSADDWIGLVDRYRSHRVDRCLSPALEADWPAGATAWTIEWRDLAKDYAGVHLSVAGWLTASSQILTVPHRGPTFCEGWPTEATMWFRPAFTGEFHRLDHPDLHYGYGRPEAGSPRDLTAASDTPRAPWWRRWLRLCPPHPHP